MDPLFDAVNRTSPLGLNSVARQLGPDRVDKGVAALKTGMSQV